MNPPGRAALRVGKNAVARLGAQVSARLLSMALVALVARYEGAAGLGRYVLVLTVVAIAGAAGDLGLNTLLIRDVAREADPERQRDLLGLILPLKLCLTLLAAAGLLAVAALAPFPPETRHLLPIGCLLLLPEAALGAMRAFVNARQRMEVSGLVDVTVRGIAVAASIPVLAAGLGIRSVLLTSAGSSLVGVLVYTAVLGRWHALPRVRRASHSVESDPVLGGLPAAYGGGADPRDGPPGLAPQALPSRGIPVPSRGKIPALSRGGIPALSRGWYACLRESYPFALTGIVAMVYARVDLLILSLWQGESAAGWYGAAYKLWETVGLLPASLLEALFPEMSRLSATPQGRHDLRRIFRSGLGSMLAVGLLLAAAGALAAGGLIPLIYGADGDYTPAVLPFRLLVGAIPAMFLYLLSGHTLYALGRQRRVTAAMLAVGIVNVVLNVIVIPRWSYTGAAAVALLSEWLLFALLYPQARRILQDSV